MKRINLKKNVNVKEVKKMKKLIMIATAIAMVVSFVPKVEAANTANLSITATFVLQDSDVVLVGELDAELDKLAHDSQDLYKDAAASGAPDVIEAAIDALQSMQARSGEIWNKLDAVLERRPDLSRLIEPVKEKAAALKDTINGYILELEDLLPVISITLTGGDWGITAGLNEVVRNVSPVDVYPPIVVHKIINDGNVEVGITATVASHKGVDVGVVPGVGTIAIKYEGSNFDGIPILPPHAQETLITSSLKPKGADPVPLAFYTPTKLSSNDENSGARAQLRFSAFPAVTR